MKTNQETFTSTDNPAFTFSYPIFQNWKSSIEHFSDRNYTIMFRWSGFSEIPPMSPKGIVHAPVPPSIVMYMNKVDKPGYPASGSPLLSYPPATARKNARNIPYDHVDTTDGNQIVVFYLPSYAITIKYPAIEADNYGFRMKDFLKALISSFDIL